MINLNACVIEIASNCYRVIIEDVCDYTLIEYDYEDSLALMLGSIISFDYDYVEVDRGVSGKGRRYRKYDISVDNGD